MCFFFKTHHWPSTTATALECGIWKKLQPEAKTFAVSSGFGRIEARRRLGQLCLGLRVCLFFSVFGWVLQGFCKVFQGFMVCLLFFGVVCLYPKDLTRPNPGSAGLEMGMFDCFSVFLGRFLVFNGASDGLA